MSKTKVMEIPVKEIQIVENVRTSIKDGQLQQLMKSIDQHGLEQPIKVGTSKSGKFVLIFGQRRLEACRKLGWKTITAQVVDEPEIHNLLVRNLTENVQRKGNTPIEVGRICSILKDRHGMSAGEIAARLSMPATYVERAINLYKDIPESVREHIGHMESAGISKNGKIPSTIAAHIMRMKPIYGLTDAQTLKLLNMARTEELTVGELEVISALLADGYTPENAIKEKENYRCYRLDVIANVKEVESQAQDAKVRVMDYLRSILFGIGEPLTVPTFLKAAKKTKA